MTLDEQKRKLEELRAKVKALREADLEPLKKNALPKYKAQILQIDNLLASVQNEWARQAINLVDDAIEDQ